MTIQESTGQESCWCGNPDRSTCCGPVLAGQTDPATAEALMRSRYSAYATGNTDYLLHSWHPAHRPAQVEYNPDQRWLGLKIKSTEQGGSNDETGTVEFVARFKINGRGHRLQERSRFARLRGRWVYLDGTLV